MLDDIAYLKALLILLAWFALVVLAFIKLKGYRKRRLVRCPELGIVTFVEAAKLQTGTEAAVDGPSLSIAHCQLWPDRKDCGMGCLSRYEQNEGMFGFDLSALRPFDSRK
jgi:hypothetical protein